METHWETGKNEKNISCPPPKLKRNRSKAHWAFPLAERKTNPLHPLNKTFMESTLFKWTFDSPLSTPNTA
jgi:hypothetical protein